jgi:S-adenosylmethionine:tRNA ribosyltransferase-isomerase
VTDGPAGTAPARIPPRFRLESYRFRLPADRIAQVPAVERTASRLMVLDRRGGIREHATFADLPRFLRPGDCLVVNDTRVLPARLFAAKPTGGRVELLALRPEGDGFEALYGSHRGLAAGTVLELLDRDGTASGVRATVLAIAGGGMARLELPAGTDLRRVLEAFGHVPLPPYIRRDGGDLHAMDRDRYQTVYARQDGAVAAPTAGLHFTPALLAALEGQGVEVARLTLHVGPGTFRPVKTDDVRDHDVGEERFDVPPATAEAVNRALADGRRVVAVGTTAVRTLETAGATGRVLAGSGATRLLILPGHRFRVVSGLVTNFHLPGSSLLLLVSAFSSRARVLGAYRQAVRLGYRFYSYGDAMFVA